MLTSSQYPYFLSSVTSQCCADRFGILLKNALRTILLNFSFKKKYICSIYTCNHKDNVITKISTCLPNVTRLPEERFASLIKTEALNYEVFNLPEKLKKL